MTDPAAPTTPENLNAETWGRLAEAIRQYAKSGSDLDWPAVEQAMRDRDAFHRAAIEAEAPAEPLNVERLRQALSLTKWWEHCGHIDAADGWTTPQLAEAILSRLSSPDRNR